MACQSNRAGFGLTMSGTIRSSQVGFGYLNDYRLISLYFNTNAMSPCGKLCVYIICSLRPDYFVYSRVAQSVPDIFHNVLEMKTILRIETDKGDTMNQDPEGRLQKQQAKLNHLTCKF